jgi:hypothetical protein
MIFLTLHDLLYVWNVISFICLCPSIIIMKNYDFTRDNIINKSNQERASSVGDAPNAYMLMYQTATWQIFANVILHGKITPWADCKGWKNI